MFRFDIGYKRLPQRRLSISASGRTESLSGDRLYPTHCSHTASSEAVTTSGLKVYGHFGKLLNNRHRFDLRPDFLAYLQFKAVP
jgi:hypothetical protein